VAGSIDQPPLPKARRAWGKLVALAVFGTLVVGGYGYAAYTDYDPATPERDEVPASVRTSPGGYRSFHFWHSGYHGGK
jgi:hypothetical protein